MHPLFIIFTVVGVGLTLIGLWLMRRALTFKRKAQAAQGRYVDATWRTSRVNRYLPILKKPSSILSWNFGFRR
jgi:hypothetical protein